jgi:hypothetical protein
MVMSFGALIQNLCARRRHLLSLNHHKRKRKVSKAQELLMKMDDEWNSSSLTSLEIDSASETLTDIKNQTKKELRESRFNQLTKEKNDLVKEVKNHNEINQQRSDMIAMQSLLLMKMVDKLMREDEHQALQAPQTKIDELEKKVMEQNLQLIETNKKLDLLINRLTR